MNKIRGIALSALMLVMTTVAAVPAPAVLAATPKEEVCQSIDGSTNCSGSNGGVTVNSVIKTVINILSIIVGAAAVIMIVIAGLKYTTSGGDSSSIASAKNTLIYALVGLVVAAMAQFIVRYVLKSITG